MSDRPLIVPNQNKPLVDAVSMGADITSKVMIIKHLPGISYDLTWTGTPTGTFSVQVSNSYAESADGQSVLNAGSWTALPTSAFVGTYPAPSGSAGNGFLDVVGTEAYAIRLVYTRVGGTGALTVFPAATVF